MRIDAPARPSSSQSVGGEYARGVYGHSRPHLVPELLQLLLLVLASILVYKTMRQGLGACNTAMRTLVGLLLLAAYTGTCQRSVRTIIRKRTHLNWFSE